MTGLLIDHLWQSTLFAAAAGLVALALRQNAAEVRFWVWFAAAAKFLVPFAVIGWATGELAAHLHAQAPLPPRLELARQVLEPMTARAPDRTIRSLARAPLDAAPWLVAAWALGTAAILSWRTSQWRALTKALAGAAPLTLPTSLPTVATHARGGPAVVGFLRPILVLPQGLAEELTPAELEAVLEHELHHAKRRDNLLALPLLLAQALFWFHPLIWWIGRRLLAERERACDEAVLRSGADAETYARGLLEVCRLQLSPAPVLAAAMGGANLKRRIRRIMADHPPCPLGAPGGVMLTAAASAMVAVPVLAGVFTATPAATARALAELARPIVVAVSSGPARDADERKDGAAPAPATPGEPARIIPASTPPVLTELTAYAPAPIRLARRLAVPAFQSPSAEPSTVPMIQAVDEALPSAGADLLRALANHSAFVVRADIWSTRLDLRSDQACPNSDVAIAERQLGGESISTEFDGPVRRFVDETLAGRPGQRDLTPAMARAVDKALPVLQPALAGRFGPWGEARLIGDDSRGRDVYLVRAGAGYVLVRVDDLGQIEAALFCAAG